MSDTSLEMYKKQLEVILSKTPEERFLIGAALIDLGRDIVVSGIRQLYPGISEIDLKTEILKRYYSKEFSQEEFDRIIISLRKYHKTK